ncbi:MAG: AAA family ATPase, partial [Candidatus Gastranaerophilales bacterium]|nr:AAA family ATPase [Candidatus Gastranaerophilales bacterium]
LTLLTTKEKDPDKLKKYAHLLFKQALIQTIVYDVCDFAVEGQITKETTDTIKALQEDLEKYPEVFRTFKNAEYEFFEQINLDTLSTDAFTNQFKNKNFIYNLSRLCREFIREIEIKWITRNRNTQIKDLDKVKSDLIKEMQNQNNTKKLSAEEQKEIDAAIEELTKTLLEQQKYFKSQKGFGYERIAGYEKEKEIFTQKFILPVSLAGSDIEAKAPGAILLYGPTGVGKTALTRAIAEQAKCKFLPFKDADTVEELAKRLEELKKDAEDSNLHTVIKIDEFDDYGSDPEAAKLFKEFIQEAPNHNITLFLTTNNPLDIDENLLKETLNIPINPADKENILAVLRFYAPDIEVHELEEIANKLEKKAGNRAYSNSQIKKLCSSIKNDDTTRKQKIMLKLIDTLVPEITEEKLAKFKSEKESLKG